MNDPKLHASRQRGGVSRVFKCICWGLLFLSLLLNSGIVWADTPIIEEHQARSMVRQFSHALNRPPVDARIDSIWKAIPALNGIEVDEEATYRLLRKQETWTGRFVPVCKQIPPRIQLDDLKPASPIFRGNPDKKQMALMVNVAWGEEYIPAMLDIFRKEGVKATFFFDGSWLSKHHDLARTIVKEGHDIGNHGYHHLDMDRIHIAKMDQEIADTNQELYKATGKTTRLFAPPSGAWNSKLVQRAQSFHMYTILWTLDTVDWRKPPASVIVQRIVPRAQNGAMVLMHPTASTVDALRSMIPALKGKGYQLVTVSELLSPTRPEPVLNLSEWKPGNHT
jgi:probable sporulation protein (polysaccharide deacetylase family)